MDVIALAACAATLAGTFAFMATRTPVPKMIEWPVHPLAPGMIEAMPGAINMLSVGQFLARGICDNVEITRSGRGVWRVEIQWTLLTLDESGTLGPWDGGE